MFDDDSQLLTHRQDEDGVRRPRLRFALEGDSQENKKSKILIVHLTPSTRLALAKISDVTMTMISLIGKLVVGLALLLNPQTFPL
jgi:hypothetical protein